ncbi:hypothetical protein [Deinococcus sp.]|uniref:hypothetical protein n=1 Tax=Deinococcus sp. TaxID=47478 RepID=UPI0028698AB4|nr:hypothetical protein [Deinococcus sp.]
MAPRKNFPLRISPELYAALERWAADDLRSVNAQMEYLLTHAARQAGRLKANPLPLEPEVEPVDDAPDTP